jgi:hypothetical protein
VGSRGDHKQLSAAAATYGRAAVSAKDDPDIHLRHAIALSAVGRVKDAEAAIARAVTLDRRLEQRAADGADPTMPSPLVARGLAILDEIGGDAAGDSTGSAETIAILAERWAGRPSGALAALAEGRGGPE